MPHDFPPWYPDWVKHHLVTFGILSDENSAAMLIWWPVFRSMGVTAQELSNASFAMLNGGPAPMRIADHFFTLKQTIGTDRNDRQRKAEVVERQMGDMNFRCPTCDSTTWVTVPHPKFCDASEWRIQRYNSHGNPVYVTAVVLCDRCDRGRATINRQQGDDIVRAKSLTLGNYEEFTNANWREQMADYRQRAEYVQQAESRINSTPGRIIRDTANAMGV